MNLKKKSDAGAGLGFRKNRRGLGVCVAAVKKLDEVEAVDLSSGEGGSDIPAAAGVYAVYDKEGKLQFLGISRRISASVQTHLQDVPDLCGSVKVCFIGAWCSLGELSHQLELSQNITWSTAYRKNQVPFIENRWLREESASTPFSSTLGFVS